MKRTVFILSDNSGCAYYRQILPYEWFKKKKLPVLQVKRVEIASSVEKVMVQMFDAEIWHFSRVIQEGLLKVRNNIKTTLGTDMQILMDFDDFIPLVSPFNPAYQEWGVHDIWWNNKWLWKDGETIIRYDAEKKPIKFSIERNQDRVKRFYEALTQWDWVTVTTEKLKKSFDPYNKRVEVLPNLINTDQWYPINLVKDDKIKIIWAGGSSHYEDLYHIIRSLANIINKYPNVSLVIVGQYFKFIEKFIPPERIERHSWVIYPALPYLLKSIGADIGIIPLLETKFNNNKSAIKWIEFASLGIPSVVSNVTPYKEVIKDKETSYLFNNIEQFEENLVQLIEDVKKRKEMGDNAMNEVKENHSWQKKGDLWIDFFERR